jgi:hypothetical protein
LSDDWGNGGLFSNVTSLRSPGRPDLLEKTSFKESMAIFAVCFPASLRKLPFFKDEKGVYKK